MIASGDSTNTDSITYDPATELFTVVDGADTRRGDRWVVRHFLHDVGFAFDTADSMLDRAEAAAANTLPTTMTGRVFAWLDRLDNISPEGYTFTCDTPGKRFVRIIMAINGSSRSVHAFYDMRTGEVYKAAGWKAPAAHVRYNLMDDASFARMIEVADWSGGYLYIR